MKTIILTKGYSALVDDDDYDFLSQWKWYLSNGYAINNDGRKKMHRLVTKAKQGEIVDHIDRNRLNNTKSNLRIVGISENVHNQKKRSNTENNYKGVNFIKSNGLWQSRCRIYGDDYFLGLYKCEIAAAYAYNKKALELSDCILINKIDLPIELLEEKLITERVTYEHAENKSNYKGVYWKKKSGRARCGKWYAIVIINKKRHWLGSFINEIDAINAVKNFNLNYNLTSAII